jgi:two-component system uhpT operon response regulator UhpA
MIEIALLDDHAILREGIKHILRQNADFNVCAECALPSEIIALLEQRQPQVLIIDLNTPEGGGFPLLEYLRPRYPEMKIIVLSMHDNYAFVSKALSLGVNSYITKTKAIDELVLGIRTVLTGNRFLSSDLLALQDAVYVQLSNREMEVLKFLLQGKSPKAIASDLGITDKTLYAHRANIMQKLKARSHAELQERALCSGLLS